MTTELLERLGRLSILQPCLLVLYAVPALDLALTAVHATQEYRGRLWRYFGAIVGVRIPDAIGFALFTVGLTAVLWAMGLAGIAGYLPILGMVSDGLSMAALGGLIGARLSDAWYSHFLLDRQGYRPNPGLSSAPWYQAEAVALAVCFAPGLFFAWPYALAGFVVGWLFFWSILPSLRLLRRLC